jgi:N-acetylglucosamine-6-phosphate deacetylase
MIIENGVAFTEDRTSFAGSTATFDRLYKVMSKIVDGDMVALSKMASTNPAKILGLGDRGVIEKGKIADLLIVDDKLEIEKIIYKGNIVK